MIGKLDLSSLNDNTGNKILLEATKGSEFGKKVLAVQCTVGEILRVMCIDENVQRDIDEAKVASISKYIQGGLENEDIYFAPLILSARKIGEYENNKFTLEMKDKLVVLDGQHRLMGFNAVKKTILTLMEKNPDDELLKNEYEKVLNFPISVKIYINLTIEEERQLFADVNTKASPVSNTLLIMYKNNDLCGKLVKEIIFNKEGIGEKNFEIRARSTRKKMMTAGTLYQIIRILNEGVYVPSYTFEIKEENYDEYKKNTEIFLKELDRKFNISIYGDRNVYLIYVPSILMGIAKYVYEQKKDNSEISIKFIFEKVITEVEWKYKNIDFVNVATGINRKNKKYRFDSQARVIKGINKYLQTKSYKLDKGDQYKWNL